jgi:carbon-monoxide dehydrogenase iron sulfur subunit
MTASHREAVTMKKIIFREEVCMGCGLCEVHCLVQHSRSKDTIKAYRREDPKPLSRIRLEVDRPTTSVVQCQNCKDPPCVMACLSGAMHKDIDSGLVVHDADRCGGCLTCVIVCPFGAIKPDYSIRRIVAKCDMCQDTGIPSCVSNCPNEALVYVEAG